jgi:nitric oxide reductase NorD protein
VDWLAFLELEEQIGRFWHRIAGATSSYRYHPDAIVSLTEVRAALGVFFRGLGGSPAIALTAGTPQSSGHRLRIRQRLGLMDEIFPPIECNHERMLLPEQLGYFPDKGLNRQHYFWLAAFFATADDIVGSRFIGMSYDHTDPLQVDLAYLHYVHRISADVCSRYPGLAQRYRRLCRALVAQRPWRSLTKQERAVEAVISMLLGTERGTDILANSLMRAICHPSPDFTLWTADKQYRTFLPVPLWGNSLVTSITSSSRVPASEQDGSRCGENPQSRNKKNSRRKEQDQSVRDDPLLLNRFEKMLSWSEMVNVNRAVQNDDEDSARDAAQALEEITVSPHEQNAAVALKFDLDLSPDDVDPTKLISEFDYPEWDYRRKHYHPRQCRVVFQQATERDQDWIPDLEARQRFRSIRRQFEALLPKREILRYQLDGTELDMDAVVRAECDLRATGYRSDRLYCEARQQSRDLAVAILVDVSLSTDSWVNGRRIIDIGKEALITLTTGLAACRDAFAIYTFTSRKKAYVQITEVKKFSEPFNARTLHRITALKPGYYTRMGAALRHVQQILHPRPERHRLILLLTDGKPNDLDYYEGRYGVEDTRRAIIEARRTGLSVFGITIDQAAQDYFPYLFGAGGYAIVAHPDRLSHVLPSIYQQLIR